MELNVSHDLARVPADIPMDAILAAPLNVHSREQPDAPEFVGLVESVKKVGIIHRIAVRPTNDGSGRYVLIDGHRRFAAARAVGLATIRADVCDVDESAALAMTVAANVQRLANDPVLEADAIASLRRAGHTTREIAAAIGRNECYVVRRERLVSLTEPWRALARRCACTTDLLERIAAYEPTVQNEVADVSDLAENYADGARIEWYEFEDAFDARVQPLEDATFDRADCAKCPYNTATHDFLFADMADDNPHCQNSACYAKRWNAVTDAEIARLRTTAHPAIEVADKWKIPSYWELADVRDAKHPQAYVYADGELRRLVWSVAPAEPEAKPALTSEEKAEAKEVKRREKVTRSAYGKVRVILTNMDAERTRAFVDRLYAANAESFTAWAKATLAQTIDGYCSDADCDAILRLVGGTRAAESALCFDFTDEERALIDAHLAGETEKGDPS